MTTATATMFDLLAADGTSVKSALKLVGPNTVIDADTRGLIRIVGPTGNRLNVEWAVHYANPDRQRDELHIQVTGLGREQLGGTS